MANPQPWAALPESRLHLPHGRSPRSHAFPARFPGALKGYLPLLFPSDCLRRGGFRGQPAVSQPRRARRTENCPRADGFFPGRRPGRSGWFSARRRLVSDASGLSLGRRAALRSARPYGVWAADLCVSARYAVGRSGSFFGLKLKQGVLGGLGLPWASFSDGQSWMCSVGTEFDIGRLDHSPVGVNPGPSH